MARNEDTKAERDKEERIRETGQLELEGTGSHIPLAVATDYSFIVPTGTMMVHPVRMTGLVIGAVQTYDYFEMIQDRILSFVSGHADIGYERLKGLMLNTEMMTKDLGTVLVGEAAVKEGLINEEN